MPLYTLLQYRSPKESKGSLVATSNFFNVTGGLIAVVVFFLVTAGLQSLMGLTLTFEQAKHTPELATTYLHQLSQSQQIPKLLFLYAGLITVLTMSIIWGQRPDFVLRSVSWLRSSRRRHLQALGLDNIPANGQVMAPSFHRDYLFGRLVFAKTLERRMS